MHDDLHATLGVSPSATTEEIHAAFRKLARQHHPDMGGDRQKFQQLNDAYQKLLRLREVDAKRAAKQKMATRTSPPTPNQPESAASPKQKQEASASGDSMKAARHLLTGKLPLQDQTTFFILVNALDIFLTYLHLRSGSYEANPIAAYFIRNWNVMGMVAFKMAIVATVCVIAQIVALSSLKKASRILNFGTVFISFIVIYSIWLLATYR